MRTGTSGIVITNITIDETESGGSAKISYTQTGTPKDVLARTPAFGSRSEHFKNAYRLTEKHVEATGTGNACTVELTYSVDEDESSSGGDENGFTHGDNDSPFVQEDKIPVVQSILLHPKFDKVSETDKILAKALLDGMQSYEVVYRNKKNKDDIRTAIAAGEKDNYEPKTLKEVVDDRTPSGNSRALYSIILAGVAQYKISRKRVTVTERGKSRQGNAAINVIAAPPGYSDDGTWMLVSQSSTPESDGSWTVVTVYEESDDCAGWNSFIYEKA